MSASLLLRVASSTARTAVLRSPSLACRTFAASASSPASQRPKATPEERLARRLEPLPKPRRYKGTVVSSRMQKTVMVEVTRLVKHSKYQKIYAKRRKFAVHDEADACRVGDVIEFAETRKFSKTKAHMVTQILKPEDYIDRNEPRRRRTEERDFDEQVSVNGS